MPQGFAMGHDHLQTHGNGANFNDSRRVDKLTAPNRETTTEGKIRA